MHSALPHVREEGEPQTRPHPQRRAVASARWDSYLAHGTSSPSALTTRSRLPSVSSGTPGRLRSSCSPSSARPLRLSPYPGAIVRVTHGTAEEIHQPYSVAPASAPYMVCRPPDRAARSGLAQAPAAVAALDESGAGQQAEAAQYRIEVHARLGGDRGGPGGAAGGQERRGPGRCRGRGRRGDAGPMTAAAARPPPGRRGRAARGRRCPAGRATR